MKKLILLLTLTLMFGQTKLETRVYEIPETTFDTPWVPLEIYINEVSGFELSNAIVDIYSVNTISGGGRISIDYHPGSNNGNKQHMLINTTDEGGFHFLHNEAITMGWNQPYALIQNHLVIDNTQSNNPIQVYLDSPGLITFQLKIAITAEFPDMDTGYIEDGFDYCVEPGANLMSYPCDSAVALLDAIPSDALSSFEGIIGAGEAATNLNGLWVGSITNLTPGSGYWIKSNSSLCFNYDCSEN